MKLVRDAGECDLPDIMELMRRARDESDVFKHFYEVDESHVRSSLTAMLADHNYIVLIGREVNSVTYLDGKTIGVFIGLVGTSWFSPTVEATELFLYVDKEYRGSRIAYKMLNNFERLAKWKNAKRIVAGNSLEINSRVVRKLYKGLGYTVDGDSFTKVLNV